MKCYCGSDMRLVFYISKENRDPKFFWRCSQYPNCKNTNDYQTEGIKLDIGHYQTLDALNLINNGSENEKAAITNEVKVQMVEILNHFIDCTWGAHYMNLLKEIIIPYLDDPYVLKYVLKGPAILEYKGNVFFGRSKTKMYDALFYCLKQVHSQEIQNFLDQEFGTRISNGH